MTNSHTQIFTFLVGSVNVFATFIAVFVIRKYKRKPLMLVGMLVMWQWHALMFSIYPLALKSYEDEIESLESYKFDWILTFLITWFVLGFAITIGPLTWLYLAEIMTEIGMGIAVAINWLIVICISYLPNLASSITTKVGPYKQNDVSPFFLIFGGWWIIQG